jgi:hypothetical protein
MSVNVADAINGSVAVVDCDANTDGNQSTLNVGVGETKSCAYTLDLPDATDRVNTATVTFNAINFGATADVDFGAPVITGHPTVNVSDFFDGAVDGTALGSASEDKVFTYQRPFVCPTGQESYTNGLYAENFPNVAKIIETGQQDDASVTVDCEVRAGVGDLVWHDLNADGIQNDGAPGQPGVSGVTVNLLDGACTVPMGPTGVTDGSGLYSFTNPDAGSYCVQFVVPNGYKVSPQDAGGDDALDSDGATIPVTLQPGEFNPTLDLGLYIPAKLGDRVWVDDGNGIQDANEPNVPGATVTLYSCSDASGTNPLGTKVTDANGNYLFEELVPGCYYVVFSLPQAYAGYSFTPAKVGSDNSVDSDADATGKSEPVTLQSGDDYRHLDAGIVAPSVPLVPPAKLGDKVWVDEDDDGVQDAAEPGVPGVTVTLYSCSDTTGSNPLGTDVTDEKGEYLFENLSPGCYYVVFSLPPALAEYTFATPNAGDNTLDSDADATGSTIAEPVTLAPSDDYRHLDAGLVPPPPPLSGAYVVFADVFCFVI